LQPGSCNWTPTIVPERRTYSSLWQTGQSINLITEKAVTSRANMCPAILPRHSIVSTASIIGNFPLPCPNQNRLPQYLVKLSLYNCDKTSIASKILNSLDARIVIFSGVLFDCSLTFRLSFTDIKSLCHSWAELVNEDRYHVA
jgi:hypothetical protein